MICEVKTRRGSRFGGGCEAVDARKRQKLRAVAEAFLQHVRVAPRPSGSTWRACVFAPTAQRSIELFDDAF